MTYKTDIELAGSDKKIFQDLLELQPSASLELNFQTRDGASAKRYLIYSWLNNNKLKAYYRVYWPEDTRLLIKRLDVVATGYSVSASKMSDKLNSIFSNMLKDYGTTEGAHEYLANQKELGLITPEELGILLCKYDEFMK
jgi:hypothetical protein